MHRYQGSETPWAIVVVHSTHTNMLTRSLLYTAITRAKSGVVLVGDRKGIESACSARRQVIRNSGLVDKLAALLPIPPDNQPEQMSPQTAAA